MNVSLCLITIVLIISAIIDLKTKTVPLWCQGLLAIFVFFSAPLANWVIPSIIFLGLCCIQKYVRGIGGADIKIILLLGVYFKSQVILIMMIACSVALFYIIWKKRREIPFVPFILTGVIGCLILPNYLPI